MQKEQTNLKRNSLQSHSNKHHICSFRSTLPGLEYTPTTQCTRKLILWSSWAHIILYLSYIHWFLILPTSHSSRRTSEHMLDTLEPPLVSHSSALTIYSISNYIYHKRSCISEPAAPTPSIGGTSRTRESLRVSQLVT